MKRLTQYLLFLFIFSGTPLYADIALLFHQPFGTFGFLTPTGHSALYLSRVCAESPVRLRRCQEGELGVVLSRYDKVAGYDWVAIPVIPFLYAVDRPEQVPDFVNRTSVNALRGSWRRDNLRDILPDEPDDSDYQNGEAPRGHWKQLVGAAYDRKIFGFVLETEEAADDAFIEMMNSRTNKRRFNFFFRNCADFTRDVINFYYPKSIKRNFVADIGIMTPKYVTKSFVKISQRNPDLRFSAFVIPQVNGDLARSKTARGVLESFIMSKHYIVPLVFFAPWVAVGGGGAFVVNGRFNPEKFDSDLLDHFMIAEYLTELPD